MRAVRQEAVLTRRYRRGKEKMPEVSTEGKDDQRAVGPAAGLGAEHGKGLIVNQGPDRFEDKRLVGRRQARGTQRRITVWIVLRWELHGSSLPALCLSSARASKAHYATRTAVRQEPAWSVWPAVADVLYSSRQYAR